MKKLSFLDRLTGNNSDDLDRVLSEEHEFGEEDDLAVDQPEYAEDDQWGEDELETHTAEPQDGELPVDMYQTDDEIIIRAIVAGVDPSDLEISITRDMVTVRGTREEYQESQDDGYFHRELFWGSFSRTLLLPEEVAIDESDAKEKHGMLEIRLPKLDKHRSTQLRVKSGAHK
ncbi:MAG: HSP20 family protein [Candidatus Paceibacteria bacterium]|jgi:HSP20 family protein